MKSAERQDEGMNPDRMKKNIIFMIFIFIWIGYLAIGCHLFGRWVFQGVNLTGLAWQHDMYLPVIAYSLPAAGFICIYSSKIFSRRFTASSLTGTAGKHLSIQKIFILAALLMSLGLLIPYQGGWLKQIHVLVCTAGVSLFLIPWFNVLAAPYFANQKLKMTAAGILLASMICVILCAWSWQISLEAELFFLWSISAVLIFSS